MFNSSKDLFSGRRASITPQLDFSKAAKLSRLNKCLKSKKKLEYKPFPLTTRGCAAL